MRGSRLALVVAVALAIVVAGGAATVLIAGRSQEEKTPPPVLSQEVPPKKGSADVADTATLSADAGADLVDIKTGSAIRTSAKPTPKPTPVITPPPGKTVRESVPQESVSRDTSRVRSTDASQREST